MPIKINEIYPKFGGKPDETTTVSIKNGTVDIVFNSGGIKKITCTVTIKNDSSGVVTRKYEYNSALKKLKILDTKTSMFDIPETAIPKESIKIEKKFHALLMEASKKTPKLSVEDIAKINIEEIRYTQRTKEEFEIK